MTTNPVAAETAVDAGPGGGRRSKAALGFAIGYPVAVAMTALATLFAVSGGGIGEPASPVLFWLLGGALAISLVLAWFVVLRLYRILHGHSEATPGARLHMRFVALFSAAALAPAIVVALFMGAALNQGLDNWFQPRVAGVIERGGELGRYMVAQVRDPLVDDVRLMASDLNRAAEGLNQDPQTYGRYLAEQAERRFMSAAYVIDASGNILARAESEHAPAFQKPADEMFAEASTGAVADRMFESASVMRVLTRLSAYHDAYLYVVRPVDPKLLTGLRAFYDNVADYRTAVDRRPEIRVVFGLSFLSTALLMLLGAIWLGLSIATRIAQPIGRLAQAAQKVAGGDLRARVQVSAERDEVDALAIAFNRMTAQLEAQRRDIVTAQEEAETRSRFIGAVLGGVSAGVLGLDRDGRISAANSSAAHLLGLNDDVALEGRRLVDVSPELGELLNRPTPQAETPPQRVDIVRDDFSSSLGVRMSPDGEGGLVLTFDDMTKIISAQRQEAWKDVARRIAHEIKNPLTPIQLSAERLQRRYGGQITQDPEIFQRCTETILRQVADIERMVDEFSSFARMPAPRMGFADLSGIARDCVFDQRLSFSDIQFELLGAEKPVGLVCDERLLAQALTNLLKNSAESIQGRRARDGEPKTGQVKLIMRDLDFGVQFEVIDNGLGFPAHNRQRLIEPYVTTRVKGTGLGLAIVARIVEDHGGLIELDDAPGGTLGAVVRFVLPKRSEESAMLAEENREGAV